MKHLLLILAIPFIMLSCVSMKKFLSLEQSYTNLKKDSVQLSNRITAQNNRIDDLTRRNISLGQDSLRLYQLLTMLRERYDAEIESSRQEILRLNGQLYGTQKRSYSRGNSTEMRLLKITTSLSKSLTAFANEIRTVLSVYDKSLYSVYNQNWELKIILQDSLLYPSLYDNGVIVYDRRRLTSDGASALSKISSLIVEKDNYDVIVREYTTISSPNLTVISSAKNEDKNISKTEIVAIIDTIIDANQTKSSRNTETLNNSAVIDIAESKRIDSLRAVEEAERIKQKEIERLASIAQERDRAHRDATDRTSIVMRNLMRTLYYKMGNKTVSREISYINNRLKNCNSGCVEIILKPNISELYNTVQELEKSRR